MESDTVLFHKRPLAGAAAGAALGVLVATLLPSFWIAIAIAVPSMVLGVFVCRKRAGWGLLLILFALLLLRVSAVPHTGPVGRYTLVGTVAEEPELSAKKTTVVLKNVQVDEKPIGTRVRLTLPSSSLRYGDTIRVTADLEEPNNSYESAAKGIFSVGTANKFVLLSHGDDAYGILLRVRRYYAEQLDAMYGDQAANAKAMLIGDRSDWTEEDTEQYANLGILHIFAVSGMHVTALTTVLGYFIRTGRRGVDLAIMVFIAGLYCALTSFSPSVLRATCFVFALRFPGLFDRQEDPPSAFCFSLVAVLLIRPYSFFTAGFMLSFGAIAGLILLVPAIKESLELPEWNLLDTLVGSISVLAFVLPMEAYCFGRVSLMMIPMSILLAPMLSALMPFAFGSLLLIPFMPHVAKALSIPPYGGFVMIDYLTDVLPAATMPLSAPHPFVLPFWYLGLFFVSPIYLRNEHHPRLLGLGLLIVALLLWIFL